MDWLKQKSVIKKGTIFKLERQFISSKLGNIQYLSHKAAGHANQNFDRDFTYGSSDNQLKAFTVNSNLFQNKYDANGNLAQEGQSRFYEWTANDKMAVFKNQAGNSTPSVYTNYFYNAQGERIKKHTRKGNKLIVTFYMDGGMFETSYVKTVGGGIDSKRFYNTIKISDEGALIATIRVGKNIDDHTPAIKYIVGDHLNNSTAVLTTSGSLINREEFYPFGETSFGGFQYKRYRYNGKEKDEESGLYEYGQRYYAPWVCRFVSVDPVAEKFPYYTAYNYAGNKPVSKVDLEGLQEQGAEPMQPIKGETQLPDQEVGVATFQLKEVVVIGVSNEIRKVPTNTNASAMSGPIRDLGIEEGKTLIENKANEMVMENKTKGIKSDNYGRPVQTELAKNSKELEFHGKSPHKDKGYFDAHRGQKVTTSGQGYETKSITKVKSNTKFLLEGIGIVADIYSIFEVVKNDSDPFTALPLIGPIAEVNATQMKGYDRDNLNMAISQGYETTRRLLNQSENMSDVIGDYDFLELTNEQLQNFIEINEIGPIPDELVTNFGNNDWKHAVLFQGVDQGWNIYAIFFNANK